MYTINVQKSLCNPRLYCMRKKNASVPTISLFNSHVRVLIIFFPPVRERHICCVFVNGHCNKKSGYIYNANIICSSAHSLLESSSRKYMQSKNIWFGQRCLLCGQSSNMTLLISELKQSIPKSTDYCECMKYSSVNVK